MARSKSAEISNVDVVVLATFLAGGHIASVDTEDVAVIANRLAPGRFSWRKYKDQINLEHVRVTLTDARKKEKGCLIEGSLQDGWLLTKAGVVLAGELDKKTQKKDLSRVLKRDDQRKQLAWYKRERERMLSSPLVERFRREGIAAISLREAEGFFRLDEYVTGALREQKIRRWTAAFELDPDLREIVGALAGRLVETIDDKA